MCKGNGLTEDVGNMGTSGSRDRQFVSRSVLNDFNDDALTRQLTRRFSLTSVVSKILETILKENLLSNFRY